MKRIFGKQRGICLEARHCLSNKYKANMNPKAILRKARRLLFLVRTRGVRNAYHYSWFKTLYAPGNWWRNLLLDFFYWLSPDPREVEIENTTICNLRCTMCEHTYWNERTRHMTFEEFKHIVDQFSRLQWIGLTGIGSSLLNRDFFKMLRYLRSKSRAIIIELFDTFHMLGGEAAKELIELQIDHIYASVDGATKRTYESVRVGAKFEDVIDNIKRFVELKRSMNAYFPELSFHYIIGQHNINELTQFVELAHSLRVHKIFFTALLHSFDEIRDLLVADKKELEQRIDDARMKGLELGILVDHNLDTQEHRPPVRRCNAWVQPFIFSDGTVIACCAQNA